MTKIKQFADVDTLEKARIVAHWLDEKKAQDIVLIDVAAIKHVAEAVLIVTAQSVRHAQALAESLKDNLAEHRIEFLDMEGYRSGQWILLDLNDVMVHIFQEDVRHLFNLEGLWSQGLTVPWRGKAARDKAAPVEPIELPGK
jgi:ribosome-associated protein